MSSAWTCWDVKYWPSNLWTVARVKYWKNRSKKESKSVNELSQRCYSSEIIIVSRISSRFSPCTILGLHKWKVYAFNSRKLFDSRFLGANSQKEDNKEINLHVFKVFATLPMVCRMYKYQIGSANGIKTVYYECCDLCRNTKKKVG